MKRIVVHIDRLRLSGFRQEDRHAVAAGLHRQLTELFSAPGMAEAIGKAGNIPRLRVAPVNVAADAGPQHIGVAVANGIGKGVIR